MATLTSSPSKKSKSDIISGDHVDKPNASKEDDKEIPVFSGVCDVGMKRKPSCDEEMNSNSSNLSSDDSSDSEDYSPESDDNSNNSSDADRESSGLEEEEGIVVTSKVCGGLKLYKLKFEDIEEKRKQYLSTLKAREEAEEASSTSEDENGESSKFKSKSNPSSKTQFSAYRSFAMKLDDDDEYLSSDVDDDDFNPMYCVETLSDQDDDGSDNEQDTESDPEVETLSEKNRKTGETLKCIKMMKNYLTIPSDFDSNEDSGETAMEQ